MFVNVLHKKITELPVKFLDNPVNFIINDQLLINVVFGEE